MMTRATGQAARQSSSAEISLDGGKTFNRSAWTISRRRSAASTPAWCGCPSRKPSRSLRLETIVQCNRGSLPYLSPGKNRITVAVADPAELRDNQLVVTYAYHTGFRNKTYEELADVGAELARAHYATWAGKPTVVQKVFTAKELPAHADDVGHVAHFEIDIPTPAGKQPVYPRMLFLRREVLATGSKPLPLPEGAEALRLNPGEELKTLPNPFTVGFAPPPKKVQRPTSKHTIELRGQPCRVAGRPGDGRITSSSGSKAKPG